VLGAAGVIAWVFVAWAFLACTELRSAPSEAEEEGDDAGETRDAKVGRAKPSGDADGAEPEADAEPDVSSSERVCPPAADAPEPLSYVVTAETVFDTVTGLMWERVKRTTEVATEKQAAAICSALVFGGHDDWRLPTRSELLSIVDYSLDFPRMDETLFPGTGPNSVWTSSFYGSGSKDVWLIDFLDGMTQYYADRIGPDASAPAWEPRISCFRTVNPPCFAEPRFVRKSDAVLDRVTGLEWELSTGSPRPGPEAVAYCKNLASVPGRPWRVPSVKESDSRVLGTTTTGFVPSAFPHSTWTSFWTSTKTSSSGLDGTFHLDTAKGRMREWLLTSGAVPDAVRCVR